MQTIHFGDLSPLYAHAFALISFAHVDTQTLWQHILEASCSLGFASDAVYKAALDWKTVCPIRDGQGRLVRKRGSSSLPLKKSVWLSLGLLHLCLWWHRRLMKLHVLPT